MIKDSPLGRSTPSPTGYSPESLFGIERGESRGQLGITAALPFSGLDIWNAWELTWLGRNGQPAVSIAELRVPATSPRIVESKSLKLYLNSLAMCRYESPEQVAEIIAGDLQRVVGAPVAVALYGPAETEGRRTDRLPGSCIDDHDTSCDTWHVQAGLLRADPDKIVEESLHSHLLRSLCPVTAQPDSGSLSIQYRGPAIDRAGLLRYIVSYRAHSDFHEACVERMFLDIKRRCEPEQLTVHAHYQRRGGIDINPFRTDTEVAADNTRLWRQ